MTVAIRFHFGHLDRMPRCAVCARVICRHSDLEFAGIAPAINSPPAAATRAGSGARAAPTSARAIPSAESSNDAGDQFANLNNAFHGGLDA